MITDADLYRLELFFESNLYWITIEPNQEVSATVWSKIESKPLPFYSPGCYHQNASYKIIEEEKKYKKYFCVANVVLIVPCTEFNQRNIIRSCKNMSKVSMGCKVRGLHGNSHQQFLRISDTMKAFFFSSQYMFVYYWAHRVCFFPNPRNARVDGKLRRWRLLPVRLDGIVELVYRRLLLPGDWSAAWFLKSESMFLSLVDFFGKVTSF